MITLQDSADQAGVSVSTVSRVLGGVKSIVPISESTRQKVWQIAEDLGYYPNVAARALSSQRTNAIGLVIPSGSAERGYQRFYGLKLHEVLAGVELVANEANMNLFVQVAGKNFIDEHGLQRMIKGRLVDTLILYEVSLPSEEICEGCPVIFLNTFNGDRSQNYIIADDFGGSHNAVNYLINHGHKRIGFISGPVDHFVSRERRRGYEDCMAKYGLNPIVYQGDLSEESGLACAHSMLSERSDVTAVFAAGDYMAIGVLEAARDMKLSVPGRLSIIGADGIQVSAYTMPTITTVVTALYSMSRMAAAWAVKLSNNGGNDLVQEIFPTEIEERDSCGPVQDDWAKSM
jgi:DNA-binding LacI/PurR family transcriptional regulator